LLHAAKPVLVLPFFDGFARDHVCHGHPRDAVHLAGGRNGDQLPLPAVGAFPGPAGSNGVSLDDHFMKGYVEVGVDFPDVGDERSQGVDAFNVRVGGWCRTKSRA
jgi:hypothetical protein